MHAFSEVVKLCFLKDGECLFNLLRHAQSNYIEYIADDMIDGMAWVIGNVLFSVNK